MSNYLTLELSDKQLKYVNEVAARFKAATGKAVTKSFVIQCLMNYGYKTCEVKIRQIEEKYKKTGWLRLVK